MNIAGERASKIEQSFDTISSKDSFAGDRRSHGIGDDID